MLIQTNKLTDSALDWAVAKCLNRQIIVGYSKGGKAPLLDEGEALSLFYPSANWAQGGPIIEREAVHLFQQESTSEWTASLPRGNKVGWRILRYGPTPLIAAMRCYVTSKLGDTVDVPAELLNAAG